MIICDWIITILLHRQTPVINPGPNDLRISLNDNKKEYDGNTYPHFYHKRRG